MPMTPAHDARPRLTIRLLGEVELVRDDTPWRGKLYDKVIALLAYLVTESDRSHSREHLAALFWPALPGDAARTNLRQALYYLRQVFGADADALLPANRESVRFVYSTQHCWIDVKTLTEQAPTCRQCPTAPMSPPCDTCLARLKRRADSYQGEFLAGVALDDAPDFDDWLDATRQSLRGQAFSCTERLRIAYEKKGRLGPALAYAQRCVNLEPWNEAGHREHMRLLANKGEHGTAQTFYDAYRDTLARDLNVEPEDRTLALFEDIHKRQIESLNLSVAPPEPAALAEALAGRRQVTILCCHIDLPTHASHGSPEQFALARSLCAAVLRRHAGYITLGQGGHIYAYMGYPQASERAGELAVHAALELQMRLRGRYRFRAGIHTGIILAGFDPDLPDIVGDVSTIAWRLCKRPRKGGITLSETTRLLLGDKFRLSAISALTPDKETPSAPDKPIPAYEVVGTVQDDQPDDAAATGYAVLAARKTGRKD